MRSWLRLGVGLALVAACCSTPAAAEDCLEVSMTVTAELSNDPAFVGLYKYTVTGSWDVGQFGLSHIDFFLALQNLVCRCDPRVVRFGSPAGTSTGEDCPLVFYHGQYLCKGDPSIPDELDGVPVVKFEPQGCEVGTSGTGTWCFYSPLPPAPYSVTPDAVAIKHGNVTCTGDLTGTMPSADCSTPAQPTTWGSMKSLYR